MEVFKTPHDAASFAAKRLVNRFWQDRIADMMRHACTTPSRDGSTPIAMHNIKVDRVAKGWPQIGSIMVTRDDGCRFKLRMDARQFKVEAV